MFSKALFKQSMKANWVKWLSATLSTCIMLAIVIIVLGNLGINNIRDSLKAVFTQADQQSYLKENVLDSYDIYLSSVGLENTLQTMDAGTYQAAYSLIVAPYVDAIDQYRQENDGAEPDETALAEIRASVVETNAPLLSLGGGTIGMSFTLEEAKMFLNELYLTYDQNRFTPDDQLSTNMANLLRTTYLNLIYTNAYAQAQGQQGSTSAQAEYSATKMRELIAGAMDSYQTPEGEFDESLYKADALTNITTMMRDVTYYTYYNQYIGLGFSNEDADQKANEYAIAVKVIADTTINTYELWLAELTTDESGAPLELTDEEMQSAITQARDEATASITDQIDSEVAVALEELGNMDIYGLIVGAIFFRIAGLLMPMVFVIMTANSLLAGQVDSGSMAYVLSTPTKRRTVTVTQMTYMIVSLFAMFALLTITSVISVWISGGNSFAINYSEVLLFNLGAFLTMFAFAGFTFMCSALFNRTKYAMGIGGGISIFSLVCTILGLFGSTIVPSAMRINAMNFFNYLSIITLYDTVSIMSGGLDYLWKFGILLLIGIATFIVGIFRFDKKDLPL